MTHKSVVARSFMAFVIVEPPLQQAISPLFRKILAIHPETAGAIAQIMEGWSRYEFAAQMAPLKEDARLDEGSKLLVANYLISSSRPGKN